MAKGHIEVPDNLKDFLTVESCEDFPLDRYLLTDNQKKIAQDILKVKKITAEMRKLNLDYLNATLLYGVAGTGKAQPLDSSVLTPDGFIKMRDVHPGTKVITPDGRESSVVSIHPQGIKEIYKVTLDDGSTCRCSFDHLWEVQNEEERNLSKETNKYHSKVRSLKDIKEAFESGERFSLPGIQPVEFTKIPIDKSVDDYVFKICDGKPDKELLKLSTGTRKQVYLKVIEREGGSETVRTVTFSNKDTASFFKELARSLGIKASESENDTAVNIYPDAEPRYIKKIESDGKEECQCIFINDPRHLYITDDYIPTHNTTFGRYIACKFKMDFAFLNFANLVGGGIMGNTAQNISAVFRFMQNQKCIFMLDEIDCISTRRGQEAAATGGELSRTTITVMQELDRYKRQKVDAIIIAATNRIEDVDLALMSRFAIKQKIIPWNNEQKERYANKFLKALNERIKQEDIADGVQVKYNPQNIHEYCARNSTLQQREIEADMIRCVANWIDSGRKNFYLEHIREKGR